MSLANKARQNLQKKQPVIENGFTKARDQLVQQQEMLEATILDQKEGMSYLVLDDRDSEGNLIPFNERHTYRREHRSRVLEKKFTEPILNAIINNPIPAAAALIAIALIAMLP